MTKITIDRAELEQALEAFRMCVPMDGRHAEVDAAFRNLRAALAEPVQEPVREPDAHCVTTPDGECESTDSRCMHAALPQPTQRKPLTEEAIDALFHDWNAHCYGSPVEAHRRFARAIEAAHGIKEEK
jgi:hypothetical protein